MLYVELDCSQSEPQPTLYEPDDFKSLSLVVKGAGDDVPLDQALRHVGTIDDDGAHAWLLLQGLRSLAGRLVQDVDWTSRFDSMIEYAGSNGWVSEDGDAVRAHIERL